MNIREFDVEHTKEIGLPIRTIKFCLLELIVRRNRETIVHYSKKSQYEIFYHMHGKSRRSFYRSFHSSYSFFILFIVTV